jgi:hypothetical protein
MTEEFYSLYPPIIIISVNSFILVYYPKVL